MTTNLGKPTIMTQLTFREIPILSIEAAMVFSCEIVAMLDLLHNYSSILASVSWPLIVARIR